MSVSGLLRRGGREVAVGVVGAEAQCGVESERRCVVCANLQVRRAWRRARRPTRAARPAPPGRARWRRCSGETQTSVMPAQSPSPATRPLRATAGGAHATSTNADLRPGPRAPRRRRRGARAPRSSLASQSGGGRGRHRHRRARRPAAGGVRRGRPAPPDASWNSESASPGGRRPSRRRRSARRCSEPDHHLRPGRQAVRARRTLSAAATASVERHPGVADRHHRVGAGAEPARGAQQPVAERVGVHGRPRRVRHPAGLLGA